jgi:hypothetical protein
MKIQTSTAPANTNPGAITTEERRKRIVELREKHQKTFDALHVPDALFFPKMAYYPKGSGGEEKVISFFPSELRKGYDIYTEFVSRDYEVEDAERTLWKWSYNPHWETEYESTNDAAPRYLIPVRELVKVSLPEAAPINFFNNIETDAPISEMTIRDLAAILLKKPVSTKVWLNDLIK